ncbi:endochitinase A [Drosophila busckii]|uniref:endochitinase A n=1 Tax=Drosophila busckii TaxID=30019 RepID=UPI00083F3E9E|nr:endochitinase A [Drosophila busckii]XP_017847521.1 endochitinase A [Drosophila busckii]
MLSKMAQPNNVASSGGGSNGTSAGGRRAPLSLTGSGGTTSRLQQVVGNNGRSHSPQNSNVNKKTEQQAANLAKKSSSSASQQRSSSSSSVSSVGTYGSGKEDEKKQQNGVSKANQTKAAQNGSSIPVPKEQSRPKEKVEKQDKKQASKEEVPKVEAKPNKKEEVNATVGEPKQNESAKGSSSEVIIILDESQEETVSRTPTSERKSRKAAAKSPNKAEHNEKPVETVQKSVVQTKDKALAAEAVEDVEMEALTMDASPIKNVVATTSSQPAATSTPGRNLFGFRSSASKQNNKEEPEVAQPAASSPSVARSFAQITGRRSIRPLSTLTPGKLTSYRCAANNSELETSSCTNTSMNATVGSEIPNNSSFSFSFFGRGRKRERTPPPPLSGSQSTNDLAQDVEMSPPKRARFDLFSLNLASPFTMLRSRFSKATINSPSARQRLDLTPPAGEDEIGEVQNVSGIVVQEEEKQEQPQQLNKSNTSNEVTVAMEAGLETPKKSSSPVKEAVEMDTEKKEGQDVDVPVAEATAQTATDSEGANRSRCAIM